MVDPEKAHFMAQGMNSAEHNARFHRENALELVNKGYSNGSVFRSVEVTGEVEKAEHARDIADETAERSANLYDRIEATKG